jgi:hypothetical protein
MQALPDRGEGGQDTVGEETVTDQERELVLQIVRKCIDLENRVRATESLLRVKKLVTHDDLHRALQAAVKTREALARGDDQSRSWEDLLREFDGPPQ